MTLCGYRMTKVCAQKLNYGILKNMTLKKLRLSFCIYSVEIMQTLMPCLTRSYNLEEINLSANDLTDEYCYVLNRLIASH